MTIGILGSPGSGKTFLASRFEKKLGAKVVYEREHDFPDEIYKNIRLKEKLFETIVWFRNKQLADYKRLCQLTAEHSLIVTDSTLYQHQMYIDLFIEDSFRREILINLGQEDIKSHKPLDAYVYISASKDTILKLLKRKDPSWALYSDTTFCFLSQMADVADNYIRQNQQFIPNLIEIKHERFDFSNDRDFKQLWELIQNRTENLQQTIITN